MNFIFVIHLICWNYLIDLIADNRNRKSKNRSNSGDANNKGGCALRARPPPSFLAMNAVASVLAVSVSVVCDQVDQVVPAHQVDDINEVHELDPVHQVDHKDEYTVPHITSHHITSHHITSHHIMSCHVMSCHVMSCHIISYHIISYHDITWVSKMTFYGFYGFYGLHSSSSKALW